MNPRLQAFRVLYHVLEEGQFSHVELQQLYDTFPDMEERDKGFIQRTVRGTLEHLYEIDAAINSVSKTKVKKIRGVIRTILRMSVYHLLYMDSIPAGAICNEAVKLTNYMKFSSLKGFVNGVLRSLIRNIENGYHPLKSVKSQKEKLHLTYSVPEWVIDELYGSMSYDEMENMFAAMAEPVKLSVLNNPLKQTLEELKTELEQEGMNCSSLPYGIKGYYLHNVNHLEKTKAFQKGHFLIQDVSSMLQGMVTAPQKDQYIIDLCAAPGGKTFHAAMKMEDTGCVDCGDIGETKIKMLKDNANRLGLHNVKISHRDALVEKKELIEKADIVIADLPCSGLGIIGRKPEIRYNLKPDDVKSLAKLQREILDVAWQYVKPGGRLIYSTCTLTRHENIDNYNYILERLPFSAESLDGYLPDILHSETTKNGYLQLIPGVHACDGFFIGSAVRNKE